MIDRYKHLNDGEHDGKVDLAIGIEELAAKVEHMNYGMHRMLCALVRARLARYPDDGLAIALGRLLNNQELY